MATRRRIFRGIVLAAALLLAAGAYYGYRLTLIAAAYHAKTLCSGVFVSQREPAAIEGVDIGDGQHPLLRLIRAEVDTPQHTVRAGLLGLSQREAVYREGRGCTLAIGISAEALRAQSPLPAPAPTRRDPEWPEGERVDSTRPVRGLDIAALRAAVDAAFDAPEPAPSRRTRAVVVVHDGRIIAERYAPGFSAEMPLLGWSLTKSVTGALVGILVRDGKLALEQPAPVTEWHRPGDARAAITLAQLLHMTSGLAFAENYESPVSDVVTMLFGMHDMAAYAAASPLAAAPGTTWKYSTGTTNILARVVQEAAGDSLETRQAFPRRALFDRLGMTSAVIEVDGTGTFAGSSFMYASARDWARFGLLYLNDGVWRGERILPPGWVKRSLARATPNADAGFGAHLWNEVPKPFFRASGARPALPADAFHMAGHEGQLVSIIPSHRLVVVRLGLARAPYVWDHEQFLATLLRAVTPP
jgi:hypothetical protein